MARAAARLLTEADRRPPPAAVIDAARLSAELPRLTADARRAAAHLHAGIHGRRRAGQGESFWQFRPFQSGEAASRVDWRRSARDDRLYVREREWEAAQTVWLVIDRSPSMAFQSSLAPEPKLFRAIRLGLAVADMLVRGGERVGLLGLTPPMASRRIVERLAEALVLDHGRGPSLAPPPVPAGRSEVVIIGDAITPLATLEAELTRLVAEGARGHLLIVRDPAEETFPFSGQTEFLDPEDGFRLPVGDAGAFAAAYRARMAAHAEGVVRIAARLGITLNRHRTDHTAGDALLALSMSLGGVR